MCFTVGECNHRPTKQLESEYQQEKIGGDFGTFLWALPTHSFVIHSTEAQSLHVITHCKDD